MNKYSMYIWFLLVYISILLPSGSIYGINVKLITSVILCICIAIICQTNKILKRQDAIGIAIFCCFILFYAYLSIINGYQQKTGISQLVAILSVVLPTWIGTRLIVSGILNVEQAKNIIVSVAFIHGAIKVISFMCISFGIISLEEYINFQNAIFGVIPISLEIDGFTRLNVPSDFIFPVSIALCLSYEKNTHKKTLFIAVYLIAIIISYSRYLWFYGITTIFTAMLLPLLFKREVDFKKVILLIMFSVVLILLAFIYLSENDNEILSFINERYFGENADASDYTRTIMSDWLLLKVYNSPLLGHGLGSYVSEYIRFDDTPWNYELQWLSLVMNFGILGLIFIIFQFFIYYNAGVFFLLKNMSLDKLVLWFAVMLMWLLVGFFNCFLMTSSAGVVFFSFWLYVNIERFCSLNKNPVTPH